MQRTTADQELRWKLDEAEVGARGPKVEAMVEVRTWKTLVRPEKEPRNVDGWVLKEPHEVVGGVAEVDPVERWRPLVCAYSWPCGQAMAVLKCESHGNPAAVNSTGHRGLFQLSPLHGWRVGGNLDAFLDPETNTRVAYSIYQESGWGPWSCR